MSITNQETVINILMKDLHTPGQDRIIFYFDRTFHAIREGWLMPITNTEAYHDLNNSYLLWSIVRKGEQEILPPDCPEVVYKTLTIMNPNHCPAEFLALLFRFDFANKLNTMNNDKTVSLN